MLHSQLRDLRYISPNLALALRQAVTTPKLECYVLSHVLDLWTLHLPMAIHPRPPTRDIGIPTMHHLPFHW